MPLPLAILTWIAIFIFGGIALFWVVALIAATIGLARTRYRASASKRLRKRADEGKVTCEHSDWRGDTKVQCQEKATRKTASGYKCEKHLSDRAPGSVSYAFRLNWTKT